MLDLDSHCKDCISFIDIRSMMIRKRFKAMRVLFFTVLQSTLETGIENIDDWGWNEKD